jgi:rhomboid protease GluP
MLRQLRDDAREYPATMALSALWVAVFLLMVLHQMVLGPGVTPGEFILGLGGRGGGHVFGDMTLRELFQGEVWRTVTATFVHYGLLHIGLNLYALYQLGCLVESWYGPGQFVAIYVLTGGGGNLLSGLFRGALRWDPSIHSGGGSVVVMGLVGLCAVVGWRARTRLGDYLRNQMILVIVLTAGLGLALSVSGMPILDNWGHACGAAVGALIGLANRVMTLQAGRSPARWAGLLGSAVLAASAAAQVADDRRESVQRQRQVEEARQRAIDDERHLNLLEEVRLLYRTVMARRAIVRGALVRSIPEKSREARSGTGGVENPPPDPARELSSAVLQATLRAFDSMRPALDAGATSADFRRARQRLAQVRRDLNARVQSLARAGGGQGN